jgi:hypothetical protein
VCDNPLIGSHTHCPECVLAREIRLWNYKLFVTKFF